MRGRKFRQSTTEKGGKERLTLRQFLHAPVECEQVAVNAEGAQRLVCVEGASEGNKRGVADFVVCDVKLLRDREMRVNNKRAWI